MAQLESPTVEEIASWNVRERGARDGSSPTETMEMDSSTATRKYFVKWDKRFDFCAWQLGRTELYTDAADVVRLSRLMPQTHPDKPKWAATKIVSISGHAIRDFDAAKKMNVFQDAEVEVLYEFVPFLLSSDEDSGSELDRYVEYPAGESEPGAEHLQFPGIGFKLTADPLGPLFGSALDQKPLPGNVGRVLPWEAFNVIWHRLPEDVYQSDSALYQRLYGTGEDQIPWVGCINSTEFFGRPIGTCLLDNVKPIRRREPTGDGFSFSLQYRVLFKSAGWNWVFGWHPANPAAAGLYMVSTDGTFATADEVGDFKSIYNARDLAAGLFSVGELS